jgi:hypothetical protein
MRILLAGILLAATAACGDDGPSEPPFDGPPVVTITAAPTMTLVGEEISVSYSATDDVGLSIVSVAWGTTSSAVEIYQVDGTSKSATLTHSYDKAGTYTIGVQATDTSGKTTSATSVIEVQTP